jgi:hypothetical protein
MHPAKQTRRPMSRLPAPAKKARTGPPSYHYLRKKEEFKPEPDSWEKYQAAIAESHDRAIAAYPAHLIISAAEDLCARTIDSSDKAERIWIQARRAALLRAIQNRNLTPADRIS